MSVDWGYVTQPHSCETCDLPITYNHAPDAGPFDNPPLWLHLKWRQGIPSHVAYPKAQNAQSKPQEMKEKAT